MTKRKFDATGHPCEPTSLHHDFWFYVQKEGVVLCSYTRGNPTELTVMPWRMVRRALDDHDKAKSRRYIDGLRRSEQR